MSDPLKIGVLGAARITPFALVQPCRRVDDVEIVAVAARDRARAEKFAAKHRIARVDDDYEALLADPDVEAIYNPLPNALHAEWTIRALEAGKHVLCEKPLAANAEEARRMADAARSADRVLMEAFHWRYHPLAERVRSLVAAGEVGALRHVEAHLCIPLLVPGDIRWSLPLAGGALMDTGCYTVSVLRHLSGEEPEVVEARSIEASPGVDRFSEARFRFPSGATGRVTASLLSAWLLRASARLVGERGTISIANPYAPQLGHYLRLVNDAGSRLERVRGESTYTCQLRAFARAVRGGEPPPTDAEDGVRNMAVIDAIYEKNGLLPRGT